MYKNEILLAEAKKNFFFKYLFKARTEIKKDTRRKFEIFQFNLDYKQCF